VLPRRAFALARSSSVMTEEEPLLSLPMLELLLPLLLEPLPMPELEPEPPGVLPPCVVPEPCASNAPEKAIAIAAARRVLLRIIWISFAKNPPEWRSQREAQRLCPWGGHAKSIACKTTRGGPVGPPAHRKDR